MEHVIQFGIGIDDETIRKRIEAKAEDEIIKELTLDAKAAIFTRPYYGDYNTFTKTPTSFFDEKIDQFLKENKNEIIEVAADRLAARLARTKVAKELKEDKKNGSC